MNYLLDSVVQPEIHIFGLTIQTFGLCLGLSFLVAGWLAAKRLGELGRNVDFAYEMVFAALIGGLVGAKLWYVVENGGKLLLAAPGWCSTAA